MHLYSKGWFVVELKKLGVLKHPQTKKSLKIYDTVTLRQLHAEAVARTAK